MFMGIIPGLFMDVSHLIDFTLLRATPGGRQRLLVVFLDP